MDERDQLIHELRALGRRLTVSWPAEDEIAARLVRESLEHLSTGSDGRATAVELDFIAWTFESQNRLVDAALLARVARVLSTAGSRARAAQERATRARRRSD